MLKRHLSCESFLEGPDNLTHLLGALMHELEPEVPNPSIEPQVEVFCANLRLGSEDRVAATHICHDRVQPSSLVLERHTVRFTRVPTVRVVSACRQEAAEDAVLSVKHREMVIDQHLQMFCGHVAG